MKNKRRGFIVSVAALVAIPLVGIKAFESPKIPMEVWQDASCGCCKRWIAQLRAAGFDVESHYRGNGAARKRAGISETYGSCHTGTVAGYAIEGHVPIREIRRLLEERPDAIGLAVPGMVVGSPGMEQGGRRKPYAVLLLHRDGGSSIYAKYGA